MTESIIEVQGLDFGYGERPLFRGLAFSIEQCEFFSIIGPNGSGKTTLLWLLCRTLVPDSGRVKLSGRDLAEFSRRELARLVAVVPQESHFPFPFLSREIVLMGRHPHQGRFTIDSAEDNYIAEEAMEATGTFELSARPINSLSGGEKQRVIIARALAQQPRILLLDEPTIYLDLRHQLEIYRLLARINRDEGITIISVSHNLSLVGQHCGRLMLLGEGRIEALDVPDKVLTPANISRVYRAEVAVGTDKGAGLRYIIPVSPSPSDGGGEAR